MEVSLPLVDPRSAGRRECTPSSRTTFLANTGVQPTGLERQAVEMGAPVVHFLSSQGKSQVSIFPAENPRPQESFFGLQHLLLPSRQSGVLSVAEETRAGRRWARTALPRAGSPTAASRGDGGSAPSCPVLRQGDPASPGAWSPQWDGAKRIDSSRRAPMAGSPSGSGSGILASRCSFHITSAGFRAAARLPRCQPWAELACPGPPPHCFDLAEGSCGAGW